jgi:hypothetical protein
MLKFIFVLLIFYFRLASFTKPFINICSNESSTEIRLNSDADKRVDASENFDVHYDPLSCPKFCEKDANWEITSVIEKNISLWFFNKSVTTVLL